MKEIMTELIEKFKKNSKLSMADTNLFEKELALELAKGEYSQDLDTILCEGPLDASMKVLAQYVVHGNNEQSKKLLNDFIYSKRIVANKTVVSGRRMVALYCNIREQYKDQNKIIEKVFLAMVRYAYKTGKEQTNKGIVELIRTSVINEIKVNSLLDLSFINQQNTWIKTRNLFIEAICEGKSVTVEKAQIVYSWLKSANKDMGEYSEEYMRNKLFKTEMSPENPKEKVKKDLRIVEEKKSDVVTDNDGTINKQNSELGIIGAVLLAETKEIANLKSQIEEMNRAIHLIQGTVKDQKAKEQEQSESIKELVAERSTLKTQNKSYVEKIKELETVVKKLNVEINDNKQFTDTVTRNREKQSEEHLNRLASKLRIDYRDYCDAKSLEMTVDLGENMREQLGTVFTILEKNGIKLG